MIPKTSKDETPSYTQLNGNHHEDDKMPNHEKKKKTHFPKYHKMVVIPINQRIKITLKEKNPNHPIN